MSNTITVNGTVFNNNNVDFRQWDWCLNDPYNVPTSRCFIEVWQKSKSLQEFEKNLQSLHDSYVAQHPKTTNTLYKSPHYYKSRASRYRRKGVKLKDFADVMKKPRKDWESLADFAIDMKA
tara:strand:+ start:1803 stop:2165 length:363 start_codon:yes stop_codon:yes gene_type:complete